MEPLEVAPAGAGSASLLHALQRAHRRSHGVLLLELEQGGAAAAEIRSLQEQRAAAAQQSGGSVQVAPHEAPAAADVLHKLGRRLTKAHMLRLGEHPWRLHAQLDNPSDWLHPTRGSGARVHSRILVSTSPSLDAHIDRGLFNLVVGTADDLGPIHLHINGGEVAVAGLLPEDAGADELFGLVIPGMTLQLLDPATQAVQHSVHSTVAGGNALPRSSVVLQWRLNPDYTIDGMPIGDIVSQFESVRVRRGVRPEQQHEQAVPPTLPPAEGFVIVVQTLTGRQHQLPAHPQWLVEHLKCAIQQQVGDPACQQALIFSGRQLSNGHTLEDSGLQPGSLVHLVLRLIGD